MKRILRALQCNLLKIVLMGVLCAGFICTVSSCSMLNTYLSGITFDSDVKNDVTWMVIQVDNLCGSENDGGVMPARTVWGNKNELTNLTFYLYGKASDGTTFRSTEFALTINATKKDGSIAVAIPRNDWNLTLAAFKKDSYASDKDHIIDINSTAVLRGSYHVDNRRWDASAHFILSDAGLTAPGEVKLSLQLDGWSIAGKDPEFTVTAALKDLKMENSKDLTLTEVSSGVSWSAKADNIAPGYYYLVVTFKRAVVDLNEVYSFTEVVQVAPAIDVTGTVSIPELISGS